MKKRKNNFIIILIAILVLFPCAVMAQGNAPMWLDSDVRNVQYPQDEYYTGFSVVGVKVGEGVEKAMSRAKQSAIGELSDKVRVMINSEKNSISVSISGSNMDEQFISGFRSAVKTASQTEIAGVKTESYHHKAENAVYAFAYVSRVELIAYYRSQISLFLNKIESALGVAAELAEKGVKMKARRECEDVMRHFATVAYAQDLLTAIDVNVDDASLQQSRSERLRNELIQTLTDLENSIYVYVECKETVEGEEVVYIADKLPALLTDGACECNFTQSEEDADYVIKVDAYIARCTDAVGGTVFCYADATINFYNVHTQKILKPKIDEAKGGWTGKNYTKAGEEAFDELAKKIAAKVIPMMKN